MIVLQDKNMISKLGKINQQIFYQNLPPAFKMKVSSEQPSIADDESIVNAFYNAPTVITVFAPKTYSYSIEDGNVMIENMMIAAHSLGIGSCFIGRAAETFDTDDGRDFKCRILIPLLTNYVLPV